MEPGDTLEQAKVRLISEVDRQAGSLLEASHEIHEHPELGFAEQRAHRLLTDRLEQAGLDVERGAYGIDTAFVARAGSTGPTIAVLCEYDALPEIGHACGHNIIAAAGLGAGLAAAALADDLGGRVVVLGTPAEEGGGGKILMAERGAFDGVDAAMMVHPADADLTTMTTLAIQQLHVTYRGVASHAAAFPEQGRNALDAAVLGYNKVAALRQHIRPDERIHGIFVKGGDKPNIVPAVASQHWYVRSPTVERLDALEERVLACLAAGAAAAGCDFDHEWVERPYADLVDNETLVDTYVANAQRIGRRPGPPDPRHQVVGSTDMGNISHLVPSIHPMIKVASAGVAIHTPAFAEFAASDAGDRAVVDGAKSMALTIADLWSDPSLLEAARGEFARSEAD
jgi:amidohydrolase